MDAHAPHPVVSIINDLGGLPAVSAATGAKYSTVSEWKRAKSIPIRYWPALIDHARELDKPIDEKTLVAAHTERLAS